MEEIREKEEKKEEQEEEEDVDKKDSVNSCLMNMVEQTSPEIHTRTIDYAVFD